ncbi:hypothetical protein [Priestia flexa]|uniref:hypothetical protein n=1 Tax=Priestia flexa TaxID=86664 RepID=UPI003CFE0979
MFNFFKKKVEDLTQIEMNELQQFVAEQVDRISNDNQPFFKTLSNYDLFVAFIKENEKIKVTIFQLSKCVVQNGTPTEVPDRPLSMLTRDITNLQDYEDFVNENLLNKLSHKQIQAIYYIMSLFRSIKLVSGIPVDEYEKMNQEFTDEMDKVLYVLNSNEVSVLDFQICDGSLYRYKDKLVLYFVNSLNEGKVTEHVSWYHVLGMISTTCFQHSLIKAGLGEFELSRTFIELAAELYPDKSENRYLDNCKDIWNNANASIVHEDGSQILFSSYNKIDSIIEKHMTFNDYCSIVKELAGY